jgi:hypothetical protein
MGRRMTKISTFMVGQSCRSALNFWAAQQHRPTEDMKIFVLHPSWTCKENLDEQGDLRHPEKRTKL